MTDPRRQSDMDTYTVRRPRWTDRIDSFVVVFAIVVAILAVPVATGVGAAVYDSNRQVYVGQAQTRQNITATVTDDAAKPDLRRGTIRVIVRWQWAATEHTGTLRVPSSVNHGDSVAIWVDEDGRLVGAPRSTTTALLDSVVVAAATWLTVAALATACCAAIRTSRTRSGWQPTGSALAP
jgi:hypothetical protein